MSTGQAPIFGLYVNLDERGSFQADVRNEDGNTVYEIKAGNELDEDESSIFDDGYMKDKNDTEGLTEYLRSLSVIPADGRILPMSEFESELDNRNSEDDDIEDTRMFTVSVTYEINTHESVESGEPAERGYDIENEEMDYGDFCRLVQDRNYSEPSSSCVSDRMWFSTPDPEKSSEFLYKGEEKFYSLHLMAVNGEKPTLEDYAEVARMAGAKVSDLDHYSRQKPDTDAMEPSL